MANEGINEVRQEIDVLDGQLLELVNRRARLAQRIGELKQGADDAPVYRPEREALIIRNLQARNPGPLPDTAIRSIWRELMSACRGLERPLRVAFLGPVGTFSEQAMRRRFGDAVEGVPCGSIDDVFRVTEAGNVDFGVVPIENSTEGSVTRSQDMFLSTSLQIVSEITVPVRHVLMSRQGRLADVKQVLAHPQALAQCTMWLQRHLPGVTLVPVSSNGEAARRAAEDDSLAAIGSETALPIYGLQPVAHAIQDDPMNRTRFLVVGNQPVARCGMDQTSLILGVPDRAGALYELIEPLSRHGVSMKRFESRPARQGGWEYYFYIDLTGHREDEAVQRALDELKSRAAFFKCLGSYPSEWAGVA
ncbi:MAG: prephenate dehydratase [Lautropia sp.]|nr:prephenate dehydratase [Lautropia sp.]